MITFMEIMLLNMFSEKSAKKDWIFIGNMFGWYENSPYLCTRFWEERLREKQARSDL